MKPLISMSTPSSRLVAGYETIQHYNGIVRPALLHRASRTLKESMVACGVSLREIR